MNKKNYDKFKVFKFAYKKHMKIRPHEQTESFGLQKFFLSRTGFPVSSAGRPCALLPSVTLSLDAVFSPLQGAACGDDVAAPAGARAGIAA